MSDSEIRKFRVDELAQLETLLRLNGLPTEDCAEQAGNFHALFEAGQLIAAGGLEPAGDYALLRSVVVDARYRGRGLGLQMTDYLLQLARRRSLSAVYLLTETAGAYFVNSGFTEIGRDEVPAAIAETRQFASLCPDNATCLVLRLPRA